MPFMVGSWLRSSEGGRDEENISLWCAKETKLLLQQRRRANRAARGAPPSAAADLLPWCWFSLVDDTRLSQRKYSHFEYIWILLNESLMESTFKSGRPPLPLSHPFPPSLSLSLSEFFWRCSLERLWRKKAIAVLDLRPHRLPAAWTHTGSWLVV